MELNFRTARELERATQFFLFGQPLTGCASQTPDGTFQLPDFIGRNRNFEGENMEGIDTTAAFNLSVAKYYPKFAFFSARVPTGSLGVLSLGCIALTISYSGIEVRIPLAVLAMVPCKFLSFHHRFVPVEVDASKDPTP